MASCSALPKTDFQCAMQDEPFSEYQWNNIGIIWEFYFNPECALEIYCRAKPL